MGMCSAGNCTNTGAKGFVVVRFPKDLKRREMWRAVVAASRRDPHWQPSDNSRLCEVHFEATQWQYFRCVLKETAVPTKFCLCVQMKVLRRNRMSHSDHTYAHRPAPLEAIQNRSHKPDCHFTGLSKVTENVALKEKLCKLQTELAQNRKEEAVLLHACDVAQQEEKRRKNDKWPHDDVKKGLISWFASGKSGYAKSAKVQGVDVPGVRTLQRRIQHIKFLPGIQEDFVRVLGQKMKDVQDDRDRDCALLFDEMAVISRRDYDPGTKSIIGLSTVPGKTTMLASKSQVFMFSGCHRKWKQIVGYEFLTSDGCSEHVAKVITELLVRAESINLNVISIVCDMGNRGVLGQLGFDTTKSSMKFRVPNPANSSKIIRCLPDPIHVIKSTKECLVSNDFIELPNDVVQMFELPTSRVKLIHLQWLNDFQKDEELKFAPRLQLKDINANHFRKMKAKSALQVFSHPVAKGLRYLSARGLVPSDCEATAWFLNLFNRFAELVTSRSPSTAFSMHVPQRYEEAILHLRLVIHVFKNMKVGSSEAWKPVQTHVIMICLCLLDIQEYLLKDRSYAFIFMARFSQDIVENLFAVVRIIRPKCSCLEAKYRLRQCAISQFQQKIKNGSYDFDEVDDFVDILLDSQEEDTKPLSPVNVEHFEWTFNVPVGAFHIGQEDVLYRMSGYVVYSLMKANTLKCSGCIEGLRHKCEQPHPFSVLLRLMNYKEGAQFEVSDELYQIFKVIHFNMRMWKPLLTSTQQDLTPLVDGVIIPAVNHLPLHTCHDVRSVLVKKFAFMRLKQMSKTMQTKESEKSTVYLASPSLASGYFVDKYRVSKPQQKKSKGSPKPSKGIKRLAQLP